MVCGPVDMTDGHTNVPQALYPSAVLQPLSIRRPLLKALCLELWYVRYLCFGVCSYTGSRCAASKSWVQEHHCSVVQTVSTLGPHSFPALVL